MWLEGAVQNEWSISAMRAERARTLAATGEDVAAEEKDADTSLDNASRDVADSLAGDAVDMAKDEPRDEDDKPLRPSASRMDDLDDEPATMEDEDHWDFEERDNEAAEPIQPFATLAELPSDLADAFEAFKLAILRHKLSDWTEICRDDVLGALDALKDLATAPSN
jgi:hypothetical protein